MSRTRRCSSFGAFFGLFAAALSAGCAAPEAQVRDIDSKADPILKRMCDALDGARALHIRVQATMERPVETGQLAEFHRTSDITMARPDRLCSITDSDDGHWSVWYRGKSLTVLDREENLYATDTVPGRLDEMFDYMAEEYDLVMPMADLLVGKTYDSLLANVESSEYLGLHEVGDTKCHHLLFRQADIDWQIWIDAGDPPLPRKLVITHTQERDQPKYVATLDEWNLAPSVKDESFTFTPPADAKPVSMSDLITQD